MFSRILGIILLLILLPVILFFSLLILIFNGRPVLFIQKRLGADGKSFKFYKFRTMVKGAQKMKIKWQRDNPELWKEYEKNNFKLKDDYRVTKLGKFLRMTSIDEIPQIINIIKGDMNFIGPRPILLREKQYYGTSYRYYIKATPGVTGMWQISGRSDTTFNERVKFDRYYILNRSLRLDLCILLKTFYVTLFKKGSY